MLQLGRRAFLVRTGLTFAAAALAAERGGAMVKTIPLHRDLHTVTADEIVHNLRQAVTSRTRVVATTWVQSDTGLKLPVRDIANSLAQVNASRAPRDRALLCVDGAHGLGVEDAGVADLGCDFLVAGCHKWLFGPRGTGLVWGKPMAWAAMRPIIPTFTPGDDPGDRFTPGGFHSFEHRW